jgi:hypothetical protein
MIFAMGTVRPPRRTEEQDFGNLEQDWRTVSLTAVERR